MERAKTGIKAILFFRKLSRKMKISKNGVLTSVDAMDITEDGKLIIPEGVEKIEKGAFDNLFIKSFMFELEIPGSLKKIEDQNFCEMSALETVTMAEVGGRNKN